MNKLILVGINVAAAVGLAACGQTEENNVATENIEEVNATEDVNMDMNMDMNADMNVDVNATDNAADTGNGATTNAY